MNRTPSAQQSLQRLPKKWAVAFVAALILYALVQPFANSRWGWKLPGLAGILGNQSPVIERPVGERTVSDQPLAKVATDPKSARQSKAEVSNAGVGEELREGSSGANSTAANSTGSKAAASKTTLTPPSRSASSPASSAAESETTAKKSAASKTEPPKSASSGSASSGSSAGVNVADGDFLYGLLKDVGREVYISPTGLRYTRGSEEGHRLKHIEKHLKDIPDRPGKHGVFDGDMAQVLRWIDDAYTRGKQGAKGVRKREEDGRTVYEAPFTKPIGYIGGRDGKRDNNPDAKRLRLVVDGDQVITAFPF